MKTIAIVAVLVACLTGCKDNSVPEVTDLNHIVVNGQPMTQEAFIQKYCVGKTENATCIKVNNAMEAGGAKSATGIKRF